MAATPHIIKLESKLDAQLPEVVVTMGMKPKRRELETAEYLPLIGEIHLRFGFPTNQEVLDLVSYGFLTADNIQVIIN